MRWRLCLLFFFISFPVFLQAQVKINEIFLTNGSADMVTPDYNYVNWVELYNMGASMSMVGFYLSDDSTNLKKWLIPTNTLTKKGFLVLYVDGLNTGFHTNFKPDPDGGVLWLSRSTGQIIDRVAYTRQVYDISYGRMPDGSDLFYYFRTPTRRASNNSDIVKDQALPPLFDKKAGFYSSSLIVTIKNQSSKGTVYYTTDGSEPTEKSYIYANPIVISSNTVLRARTFENGKAPGEIITASYLIQRKPAMSVVSLSTAPANLTDNTIGIYVEGTNGIEGNCYGKANWNRDWERPANFEFFDSQLQPVLNQNAGIKISGACSRTQPQKSLTIHARDKYGKGKFDYKFFHDRAFDKFNSLFLRNGGNDVDNTVFRDEIFQKLTDRNMDLDHQAFEPSVLFINGKYYGIQTLYERSGTDLIEEKFGLTDDMIDMVDVWGNVIAGSSTDYMNLINFANSHSLVDANNYKYVTSRIDLNEYIDYLIFEIFIGNHDWPGNNMKIWKKKGNNKWRWVAYDTDFGFGLYSSIYDETVPMVFDSTRATSWPNPLWTTILPRRLVENPQFRQVFLNRFFMHINSTFRSDLVKKTIDSVANLFNSEMPYHCNRWGKSYSNWQSNINDLKVRAEQRPDIVINQLIQWFNLNSTAAVGYHNLSNIYGKLAIDDIQSVDTVFSGLFPVGSTIHVSFIPPEGFSFKRAYRIIRESLTRDYFIKSGDLWKYWDKGEIGTTDWLLPQFEDSSWSQGPSELGYGDNDEKTVVSYGNDANNKYITTYFRKTFVADSAMLKDSLVLRIKYDDGAVIYFNGNKQYTLNFPSDSITYSTLANNCPDESAFFEYPVDHSWLHPGNNTIAVEIHQTNVTSSDISFDFELVGYKYSGKSSKILITNQQFTDTINGSVEYWAEYQPIAEFSPSLIINEMVLNNASYPDEFGDLDSWLEIYNTGMDTINLTNYYFTDSTQIPYKYQISRWHASEVSLPPSSYGLLWIDNQPWQGALHLPFKLKNINTLYIFQKINSNYILVDSVENHMLYGPYSLGRYPDVTGALNLLCFATPLKANEQCFETNTLKVSNNEEVKIYYSSQAKILSVTLPSNLDNVANIQLIDMQGKILMNEQTFNPNFSYYLGNFRTGIYIIRVFFHNNQTTQKIVTW
jgi:hypothetical protein